MATWHVSASQLIYRRRFTAVVISCQDASRSCQSSWTHLVRPWTPRHVRPPRGDAPDPPGRLPSAFTYTPHNGGDHAVCQAGVRACSPDGAVRVQRLVLRRRSAGPAFRARSHHERGDEAPDHHVLGDRARPFPPGPAGARSRPIHRCERALQAGRGGRPNALTNVLVSLSAATPTYRELVRHDRTHHHGAHPPSSACAPLRRTS